MANDARTDVLDAGLDLLATCDRISVCQGQPATIEEASTTLGTGAGKALAQTTLDPGDFAKGDHSNPAGRQQQIAEQSAVTIDATGTADHVAIWNSGDATSAKPIYVALAVGSTLEVGGQTDIGTWIVAHLAP